jgi:hypothetical protein
MTSPQLPTELYTPKTLYTLGGSSTAVWLFTTILASTFGVDTDRYKWIGLCVAIVLSFIGAIALKKLNFSMGTVALFNGLLIYVTSVGINSLNEGIKKDKDNKKQSSFVPFLNDTPWWPSTTLVDSIHFLKTEFEKNDKINNLLVTENLSLKDSLKLLKQGKTIVDKTKSDPKLKTCLVENAKLLAEIEKLKKQLQTPALTSTGNPNQASVNLLRKTKELNKELNSNLNKYLKADKPKDQLEVLQVANENIYELKTHIDEYNEKLTALINEMNSIKP